MFPTAKRASFAPPGRRAESSRSRRRWFWFTPTGFTFSGREAASIRNRKRGPAWTKSLDRFAGFPRNHRRTRNEACISPQLTTESQRSLRRDKRMSQGDLGIISDLPDDGNPADVVVPSPGMPRSAYKPHVTPQKQGWFDK